MVAFAVAFAVGCFATAAELIHRRRTQTIRHLAFGPTGTPSRWAEASPFLRILGITLGTWGIISLALLPDGSGNSASEDTDLSTRHLILLWDVSPSMDLQDAGQDGQLTRKARGRELLESIFQRGAIYGHRTSVFAFYTEALPVVEETTDPEVIRNILNDLPMYDVFKEGRTNLFAALDQAAHLARNWKPDSTSIIVVSDGDTVPADGMPKMPSSVAQVLVLGVGDAGAGTFIDGHQSRQDTSMLGQTATRLGGHYHDGNQFHLETSIARRLLAMPDRPTKLSWNLREAALAAVGLGAFILAILPWLLAKYGTLWNPGLSGKRATAGKSSDQQRYAGSYQSATLLDRANSKERRS
ncbi:VWA domain-containing protein [Bremerella cremea]|uniref:VWFA domain-containing protein n=1 Tax=Blastopirellula marina TaxID=124 RepID=A0A2S8FZH9_9BACT|nr:MULTISPECIES: VWA domain-containing protein [Pirellulaceae]PQO37602.1 hypothetical protein C5Y83_06560 [Blastopirellula marina]RCS49989.1 VWA domain-containing protein [Bremerella cremea]